MSAKIKNEPIRLTIFPTVFPDLNKKLAQDSQHETSQLLVQRLKHKHIRMMQGMSESEQIEFIMADLTGLSSQDLDELDADDSAALTDIIFGFMKRYAEMAKSFMA